MINVSISISSTLYVALSYYYPSHEPSPRDHQSTIPDTSPSCKISLLRKISGLRWSHVITDMVNPLKENRHAMGLKFLRDIGRPLCIVIGWLGFYLTYLQVKSGRQRREKN